MKKVLTLCLGLVMAVALFGQKLEVGKTSMQEAYDLLVANNAAIETAESEMITFALDFPYEGIMVNYGLLLFHEDVLVLSMYFTFTDNEEEGSEFINRMRSQYGEDSPEYKAVIDELIQEMGIEEITDSWYIQRDFTAYAVISSESILTGIFDHETIAALMEEDTHAEPPFAYDQVLGMVLGETSFSDGTYALRRFGRQIDNEDETIQFDGNYQWGNINFTSGKAYFYNDALLGVAMTNTYTGEIGHQFMEYVIGLHSNIESDEQILPNILLTAMEVGEVEELWCTTQGDACLIAYTTANTYGYVVYSIEAWGVALAELFDEIEEAVSEEQENLEEPYDEREPDAWYGEDEEIDLDQYAEAGSFFYMNVGEVDEYMSTMNTILYESDWDNQDLENGTYEFGMEHAWENSLMKEGVAIYHDDVFGVIISTGTVDNNKEANAFLNKVKYKYDEYVGIEDQYFAQFLLMLELGTNWSVWSRVGDVGIYACVINNKKIGIYYHIPTLKEMMTQHP